MIRKILLFSVLLLFIAGCSPQPQLANVIRFDLVQPKNLSTTTSAGETLFIYNQGDLTISFAPFQYGKLVVLFVKITNNGAQDLLANGYGFVCYDGRDMLTIKRVTEADLAAIQHKLNNPQGFNLTSPSLQGAVDTFNSLLSFPANSELSDQLKKAANQYFAFRPVWAGQSRQGFVAFFHEFRLEYPLTFELTLNGKKQLFYFYPKKAGEK